MAQFGWRFLIRAICWRFPDWILRYENAYLVSTDSLTVSEVTLADVSFRLATPQDSDNFVHCKSPIMLSASGSQLATDALSLSAMGKSSRCCGQQPADCISTKLVPSSTPVQRHSIATTPSRTRKKDRRACTVVVRLCFRIPIAPKAKRQCTEPSACSIFLLWQRAQKSATKLSARASCCQSLVLSSFDT